jgi:hypothetical protein
MINQPVEGALLAKRRLQYQLRASEMPGAAMLAEILDLCAKGKPCRSAACPVCGRLFQAAAVSAVDHFIREPARALRSRMHATTIVPASGCLMPDALTLGAILQVKAEIEAALTDLNLPPSLVGVEVSFNEDTTGEVEPHWCVHCHGICLDWLSKAQREALRARFPPSPLVRRPTRVEPLDQDIRGRQYPFKSERCRRVTSLVTDDPARAPYRQTKDRPLRPAQAVTLALVEHQLGFEGRLLTHKISREAVLGHLRACRWA